MIYVIYAWQNTSRVYVSSIYASQVSRQISKVKI